ncbi:MAG: peptidoglycan-binding domain-containing protein [Minisyncoccia bacterium]
MKKYIGILFLVGFFIIPSLSLAQQTDVDPLGNSNCAVITHNLRLGSRDVNTNDDVSLLQDFLNTNKFLTATASGYFGNATLKAVKTFQKSNGISPTGYVGSFTIAKIKEIDCVNTDNTTTTPVSTIQQPTSTTTATAPAPAPTTPTSNIPQTVPKAMAVPVMTTQAMPTTTSFNASGTKMNDQKYNDGCLLGHKFSSMTGLPCTTSTIQLTTTMTPEVPNVYPTNYVSPTTATTATPVPVTTTPVLTSSQLPVPLPTAAPVQTTVGCTSTSSPSITVLSPYGGETYTAGQQMMVKWTSCNLPNGSAITAQLNNPNGTGTIGAISPLTPQNKITTQLVGTTADDGIELFTLPPLGNSIYGYGKNFNIYLTVHYLQPSGNWGSGTNVIYGQSNNLFTINSSSTSSTACGLSVAKANNSPSGYIQAGTVAANLAIFNLTASSSCDVKLTGVSLNISGSISDGLTNVSAYNSSIQLGSVVSSPSVVVNINTGINDAVTILAGQTIPLTIKGDLSSTSAGRDVLIQLTNFTAIDNSNGNALSFGPTILGNTININ